MNGLDGIIKQLEAQKTAIEHALASLKAVGGEVSGDSAVSAVTPRDKRSAAQKARWAAKRAASQAPTAAPGKRKGGITPEGRKKLAEAMKRRWAAKASAPAPAAKKGPGRPKKAVQAA